MCSGTDPCAYFNMGGCVSKLTHHSWAVHDAAVLAAERLLGRPRELPSRAWLELALRVAAVYHDLGKAAVSFQRQHRSFRLHEHVGALILWRAAEKVSPRGDGDAVLAKTLMVAAGAVARHHAAMLDRHPAEVLRNSRDIQNIARLAREVPPGVPSLLAGGSIPATIEEALGKVRAGLSLQEAGRIAKAILDMLYFERDLLADTMMVAGTLIVADILVASVERNDEVSKSYAKSWMKELGISMEKLQQITRDPSKPTLD